jgi:hypothetical protein
MNRYDNLYGIGLLDDVHNYFPAFLYDQAQFQTTADVFRYVNRQIAAQCNPYRRGLQEYTRTHPITLGESMTMRTPTNRAGPRYTENIDITPMFTQAPATAGTTFLAEYLLGMLQVPGTASPAGPVVPTQAQVDSATTLRVAVVADETRDCSICQTAYTDGQALRTITRCEHMFHKSCIDPWFARNSQCPNCRFDIRM